MQLDKFTTSCYLIFYMTATTHALVGAAITSKFPNLWGLVLAFLVHFPLDFIPHWDTNTNGRNHSRISIFIATVFDVLLALGSVWYFFGRVIPQTLLLASVIVSQLPDWLSAPYLFLDINLFPFHSVYEFQARLHHKLPFPLGLLPQIILILFVFFLFGVIPVLH